MDYILELYKANPMAFVWGYVAVSIISTIGFLLFLSINEREND